MTVIQHVNTDEDYSDEEIERFLMKTTCKICNKATLPDSQLNQSIMMKKWKESLTLSEEPIYPTKRVESDLCYYHKKCEEIKRGQRMSEHQKKVNLILYGKEVV